MMGRNGLVSLAKCSSYFRVCSKSVMISLSWRALGLLNRAMASSKMEWGLGFVMGGFGVGLGCGLMVRGV